MAETQRFINSLFAPFAGCCSLVADYTDASGNWFNREFFAPASNRNACAVALKEHLEEKGYTVVAIQELLDGFTSKQLEKMSRSEMKKHVRPLFVRFDILAKEAAQCRENKT